MHKISSLITILLAVLYILPALAGNERLNTRHLEDANWIEIGLVTPGQLENEILTHVSALSDVTHLKVSGEINTDDWSTISQLSNLIAINLENAVTYTVPYGTFQGCSSLRAIDLPVTLTAIGSEAFYECSSLTDITLPESLRTLGDYVFLGCSSLTAITIPELITTIPMNTFYGCTSLASVILPDSLKEIGGYAFKDCSSLTTIEIPDAVTIIRARTFQGCTGLISIALPGSLNYIYESAFQDCSSLTTIDIPETVLSIRQSAFSGCSSLTAISLPESITTIEDNTFQNCSSLTHITLPNTLTKIGFYAFDGCSSLTDITLPESLTTLMGVAFRGCINLKSIIIPEGVTSIPVETFQQCSGLTSVTLPGTLKSIGRFAFYGCTGLTAIDIPASLTEILDQAFDQCTRLNTVCYYASSPVKSEAYNVFDPRIYDTANLNMPNALLADIEATVPWSNFRHIVAKDGVAPPELSAGDEFEYDGIKYTVIDPVALTCQTKAGYAEPDPSGGIIHHGGNSVSGNLNIPATVSNGSLDFTVVGIGGDGFTSSKMTSISFPSTLTTIGEYAFMFCNHLTHVEWPETVPEIPGSVFAACRQLSSVTLPESLSAIGSQAFSGCASLDSITLPTQVRSVGNYAFMDCTSLKKVTINGTQTRVLYYAFMNCPNLVSLTLSDAFGIGYEPFYGCSSISSIVWKSSQRIPADLYSYFGNPNLMVYADHHSYPLSMQEKNIVVREDGLTWVCYNLSLTQGYPFQPMYGFIVDASEDIVIDFNQTTPIDGCAGWQTITLPFDVFIVSDSYDELTPFGAIEDLYYQRPFWLYEADSESGWKEATKIRAGVPYIISMPNNEAYDPKYNISGPIKFTCESGTIIKPEVTNSYSVNWRNGMQFRSLWMPLSASEAEMAMGLNVGIDDLRNDDGDLLLPGSAFHRDVKPRPLEAYVRSDGSRMSMPIIGGQSHVALMKADNGLSIHAENGSIFLKSDCDRTVEIYRIDGVRAASIRLDSGEPAMVDGLAKGLYIVADHKVIVK